MNHKKGYIWGLQRPSKVIGAHKLLVVDSMGKNLKISAGDFQALANFHLWNIIFRIHRSLLRK